MATTGTTRRGLLRAGLAGVVVLVLGGLPAWAATGAGAPSCRARDIMTIVSSTEKDGDLAESADEWNRDPRKLRQPCAQVVGITSGLAQQRIAAKGYDWTFRRDDKTVKGERLPSGSPPFFDLEKRSIAWSPLVVVGHPKAIATLRVRTEAGDGGGWPALVKALHDSRADLRYTQENALLSTSGAQAALTLSPHLKPEALRELQSETDSVIDSTYILADWAKRGVEPNAVMLLQAQMAWAYNRGDYSLWPGESEADRNDATPGPVPTSKLDVYLPGPVGASSFVADHPFLVRSNGEHADAMRDFYKYLLERAEDLCDRGYFAGDSACTPPTMTAPRDIADRFADLSKTQAETIPTTAAKTLTEWDKLRKPRSLLVLVDVSGSQSDPARPLAKPAALAAASNRLRLDRQPFGPANSDRLTVWAVGGKRVPVQLPNDRSPAGWQSALEAATTAADPDRSDILGAVCLAQSKQSDWADPDTTRSLVVLSDGVQDLDGSPRPDDLKTLFPIDSVNRSCPEVTKAAWTSTYAVHYALKPGSYPADNAALAGSGQDLMERLGGDRYRPARLDEADLTKVVREILRSPSG